jgi:hypothetical protein
LEIAGKIVTVPGRSTCRGTVALIVAVLVAVTPSSASAFSKAIWGPVYRNGVNQFPLYHELGVSIYEADVFWNQVAPTRPRDPSNPRDPAYRWPLELQQAMRQAARFHMSVMLQVIGAPAWANGGHSNWSWAPRDPQDFATFAAAAARRYPSVHLWMIWGEPTRPGNFHPIVKALPGAKLNQAQRAAPHLYARMLDAAYGALKRVSRRNVVIGGCTYTTGLLDPLQWIQNLRLPNGRPPRMDMYAHNPFSYKAPSFSGGFSPFDEVQFSDLHELGHWIDRYIHPGLPLFLSEWTIPTAPDQEFDFWVDPSVAAQWISDALALSRHWKRIYALGWVHVYDDPPLSAGGLLTAQGVPKPGFAAFAHG